WRVPLLTWRSCATRFPRPSRVLAFCTRSVYELYLIARKVLSDKDEISRWMNETASDNLTLMKALNELVGASAPTADDLRKVIEDFKQLCARAGLNTSQRPPRTADLAKEFGLEKEHKAFFALYSKLVHPSAFLVNSGQQNPSEVVAKSLLFALLDYA